MKGQQYKYKAFISYSHKDTYWAKWLKYRLDTFSSKIFSLEKHPLREVFLDQYNLSVNDLKEKGLPENLQHSKYLICLCTRHYNSEWVELEITEFKKICENRGVDWKDYIIPICINGNADIIQESLKDIKAITIDVFFISTSRICYFINSCKDLGNR
ncbi:MAG: toll/interleukin-1 receptor domain-containing protein [Prevotellaceae bacterium]|nr:toll/interleukin-1 receptor domain-containing protein [Prevotellaceae bacterium]